MSQTLSRIPDNFFKIAIRFDNPGQIPPRFIPVNQLKIMLSSGKELELRRFANYLLFFEKDGFKIRTTTYCAYDPETNIIFYYVPDMN